MLQVFLLKLEYADDAALINRMCEEASERVSRLDSSRRANRQAGLP